MALTYNEERKLKQLIQLLTEEESIQAKHHMIDHYAVCRERDEKGRFLPNQVDDQLESTARELELRSIKLVKVRGSYGSYVVKDVKSDISEGIMILIISVMIVFTIFLF